MMSMATASTITWPGLISTLLLKSSKYLVKPAVLVGICILSAMVFLNSGYYKKVWEGGKLPSVRPGLLIEQGWCDPT